MEELIFLLIFMIWYTCILMVYNRCYIILCQGNMYEWRNYFHFEIVKIKDNHWQNSDCVLTKLIIKDCISYFSSTDPNGHPSVRLAVSKLVLTISQKLLVLFHLNFTGVISIKSSCAYHQHLTAHWFLLELRSFYDFYGWMFFGWVMALE